MRARRVIPFGLAFAALATTAGAQPASRFERGYITGAADLLVAGSAFADATHPIDFAEASTINASYGVKLAPGLTVGGGVRVWRRLAVGLEVGYVTRSNDTAIDARVPHPFLFERPRSVTGTAALRREETAVHVVASWAAPIARRWQLAAGGGPSWLRVGQDLVRDIIVAQTYPYDTATYAGARADRVTKGRIGVNAGAEAIYLVRPRAGISVGARFSHAHVPLSATASTAAGGAHVTAGLRLRF